MSNRTASVALAGLLLAAAPASAQTRGRGTTDWSVLGSETVAPGSSVLHGAFGWPDVTFQYTYGMSQDFDVGLRMQLVYGFENTTEDNQFGMAFAVPLRFALAR